MVVPEKAGTRPLKRASPGDGFLTLFSFEVS